eukprot:TRINITY_DN42247_c0_g1_i1.p1 TRINITY_DN42247_c0_g1~~TRINITY_DN42247_c0_g1_i1.p1  ORF type:complete len:174 (+),score=53.17 TRINITY_DN42247_c0_g1_i1:149-670(+)
MASIQLVSPLFGHMSSPSPASEPPTLTPPEHDASYSRDAEGHVQGTGSHADALYKALGNHLKGLGDVICGLSESGRELELDKLAEMLKQCDLQQQQQQRPQQQQMLSQQQTSQLQQQQLLEQSAAEEAALLEQRQLESSSSLQDAAPSTSLAPELSEMRNLQQQLAAWELPEA